MEIASPAFADGDRLADRFTCDGEDVSPPLRWSGVPPEASSLALLVEEPDAPVRALTLWSAWGIDPAADGLGEGERAPVEGRNDYGAPGYRGPCPPRGREHRYVFRLYALDAELDLEPGRSRRSFDAALEGHVVGTAELAAAYERR
jgi:Raf kinase inhibitor-like YbhB/YbcL family protein